MPPTGSSACSNRDVNAAMQQTRRSQCGHRGWFTAVGTAIACIAAAACRADVIGEHPGTAAGKPSPGPGRRTTRGTPPARATAIRSSPPRRSSLPRQGPSSSSLKAMSLSSTEHGLARIAVDDWPVDDTPPRSFSADSYGQPRRFNERYEWFSDINIRQWNTAGWHAPLTGEIFDNVVQIDQGLSGRDRPAGLPPGTTTRHHDETGAGAARRRAGADLAPPRPCRDMAHRDAAHRAVAHSAARLPRISTFVQPAAGTTSRAGPRKTLSATRIVSPPGANVIAWVAWGPLVNTLPRIVTLP